MKNFWTQEIEKEIPDFIVKLDINLSVVFGIKNMAFDEKDNDIKTQTIPLTASQMFFDEPWYNIEYEERDRLANAKLNHYGAILTAKWGKPSFNLSEIASKFTDEQLDTYFFSEILEPFYELNCACHVWKTDTHYIFLNNFQEDKELPIEINLGRISIADAAPFFNFLSKEFKVELN